MNPSGVSLQPVEGVTNLIAVGSGKRVVSAATGGLFDVQVRRIVRNLSALDYLCLFGYFALVSVSGIRYSRRQQSSESFALGDRRIPWWMAGISMFATGASSISFMAIPAQSFRTSLLWSYPFLMLIPLYFLEAWVLYPLVRHLRITSTFEYLERRFHPSLDRKSTRLNSSH